MTLLQEVAISAAAAVCPRTVFTQLVTEPPDLTVVIVWAIKQAAVLYALGIRMRITTCNLQPEYREIKSVILAIQG